LKRALELYWSGKLATNVISIEATRSGVGPRNIFSRFDHPDHIGPGVYDIHSPLVPSVEETMEAITQQTTVLDIQRPRVYPDCGLKTHRWEEVRPSLTNMVAATRRLREQLAGGEIRPHELCQQDRISARTVTHG
jgi:5-methyltetrahydropteroyltriglutamate--homocysteine methyltransferase